MWVIMASGLNFGLILFLRLSHGCEPFETESDGDRLLIFDIRSCFAQFVARKKRVIWSTRKKQQVNCLRWNVHWSVFFVSGHQWKWKMQTQFNGSWILLYLHPNSIDRQTKPVRLSALFVNRNCKFYLRVILKRNLSLINTAIVRLSNVINF